MLLLALLACHSTRPAPDDLDGLAHWFWSHYDGADAADRGAEPGDDAVLAASLNLDAAVGELTKPMTGTLTDLSADEQAVLGLDAPQDIAAAAGMFLMNTVPCSLDQIERITIALEQDALYPDTYTDYARSYTSDVDAYLARETPYLTWASSIDAEVLGAGYHEDIDGGARYVSDPDGAAFGDMLMTRVYLPTPATFEDGNDAKSFTQDYQLEIYYSRDAGTVVHAYVLWRQMDYGGGLDTDDSSAQSLMLSALIDWDDANAGLCADGF